MAEPGISIFLDSGIIVLILTNIGLIAKEIIRNRNFKRNGNPKMCIDHEKRITTGEAEVKNLGSALEVIRRENREDHQKIMLDLNNLRKQ